MALLFSLLMSLHARAGLTSVDTSYFKGDYGNTYHESGHRVLVNTDLGDKNKFYLGYEHARRDYTSEVGFYRDAVLIGDTVVFDNLKSYVELAGAFDDDTLVGPQTSVSMIPHTSYFTNWDLALGFHYGKYETGEVQSYQPQIIYFINEQLSLGHSSWFYDDSGWHHAHREFFRARYERYSAELSWAGGENREDVGFIDPFNSYAITISYVYKKAHLYLNLEDYQGQTRRGSQWGVGLKWQW
ncbi:hypothetical protein AZI86_00265 [Bdellovibrio bacteriovorus]|uniref:Uncharacterized protein n=1 Tax=Bdellovibrio bacteriovorus TaxID=959 RepID=A0A150WMN6_BDEBC|nr:hypothetical protein [Bdellovibrio bacteriovorus]KYG65549.1 hypothetical protein AZI86_00265 [Bdellovibrio bacteriovorus]